MRTTLRAVAGLVIVAALAAVALVSMAGQSAPAAASADTAAGSTTAPSMVTDAATIAEGQSLFVQSCSACHGTFGDGSANGPSIINLGEAAVDFVLRTGRMPLSNPRQPMTRKPPAFTDKQISAIDAYIGSIGTGPAIPQVVTSQGNLQEGRQLFVSSCAACHSVTASGDSVGGGFVAPPLNQATATQVGEAMRVGPGVMPIFNSRAYPAQAVDSVAAYILSLRSESSPGGLALPSGPIAEGFVAWLVGVGALMALVRWVEPGRREDETEDEAA